MGEFQTESIRFVLEIFTAVVVGIGAIITFLKWKASRKIPDIDISFVLNLNRENESTTTTINVPTHVIVLYFAIKIKDNREYHKPYIAIDLPSQMRIVHHEMLPKLYAGTNVRLTAHNRCILFSERTFSKKQLESGEFPLIINTQGCSGEYTIKTEIGAPNLNAKGKISELKISVVSGCYSQDEQLFDTKAYEIP